MNTLVNPQKGIFEVGGILFQGMGSFYDLFTMNQDSDNYIVRYELVKSKLNKEKSISKLLQSMELVHSALDKLDFTNISSVEAQKSLSVYKTLYTLYQGLPKIENSSNLSKVQIRHIVDGIEKIQSNLLDAIEALEIYANEDVMNEIREFMQT